MHYTIQQAIEADHAIVAHIGRLGVEESHRDSCSAEDMQSFLTATYNDEAIPQELTDANNLYHLIFHNNQPAGFSKIVLNAAHPNIDSKAVTKLDRIYLLKEYYDQKLGFGLLQHNIELSRQQGQSGIWLFTWQGNERAVNFYKRAGFTIIGSYRFKVTNTHYNQHHQMLLRY